MSYHADVSQFSSATLFITSVKDMTRRRTLVSVKPPILLLHSICTKRRRTKTSIPLRRRSDGESSGSYSEVSPIKANLQSAGLELTWQNLAADKSMAILLVRLFSFTRPCDVVNCGHRGDQYACGMKTALCISQERLTMNSTFFNCLRSS